MKWKSLIQRSWLRNKYVLSTLGFLLWILMFHDLDAIFVFRMRAEMHQTENQVEYFRQRNAEIQAELTELNGNKQALEKFAREQYFMKKENEDLFVFFESED